MLHRRTVCSIYHAKYIRMEKQWVVQQAKPSDAVAIARFQVAMAQETEDILLDYSLVLRGVSQGLTDRNKGTYYIVYDEAQQAVGSLFVTREWSDWRCLWYWWIQSVYVCPDYRHQGVFRALYQAVRRDAIYSGSHCLRLYADRSNARALAVYKAMGMTESHYLMYEEEF